MPKFYIIILPIQIQYTKCMLVFPICPARTAGKYVYDILRRLKIAFRDKRTLQRIMFMSVHHYTHMHIA